MVYLLTFVSALLSVIGNITSKYWSDSRQLWLLVLTFVIYNLGTIPWLLSLRLGKFTLLSSLFYALVPLITILSGAALFRDKLTPYQLWGIVLSMIGILLFTFEGKLAG